MKKILLRQDSRDVHYADHFGQVDIIPSEVEFDRGQNPIEPNGAVTCTAISGGDVCTNQTGIIYDTDDLWARTPKNDQGADPRDSMAVITKQGLQPLSGGPRDTRWLSYMRSDGNSGDYAQTTMSNCTLAKSPTTVASNWYNNWNNVLADGVMPQGDFVVSGHDYEITGWRQNNGVQFHIKDWSGNFKWMSREIYNKEMDKYGTGAYLPTTKEIADTIKISRLTRIRDILINIVLLLKQLLLMK